MAAAAVSFLPAATAAGLLLINPLHSTTMRASFVVVLALASIAVGALAGPLPAYYNGIDPTAKGTQLVWASLFFLFSLRAQFFVPLSASHRCSSCC
jgi:hypothetical protein